MTHDEATDRLARIHDYATSCRRFCLDTRPLHDHDIARMFDQIAKESEDQC